LTPIGAQSVVLKDERRTLNIERPISNEKQTSNVAMTKDESRLGGTQIDFQRSRHPYVVGHEVVP